MEQRIGAGYCSIEQRVSIVEQVYSSIRGFGLLDSIIKDDTITEVMINGPENVFIEQNGRLFKLDKQFESQRKLEDIIQRIVGLAGREVNQANPICDTRLPDGSPCQCGAAAHCPVRPHGHHPKVLQDPYDHCQAY